MQSVAADHCWPSRQWGYSTAADASFHRQKDDGGRVNDRRLDYLDIQLKNSRARRLDHLGISREKMWL
jgi:hypothetical protein